MVKDLLEPATGQVRETSEPSWLNTDQQSQYYINRKSDQKIQINYFTEYKTFRLVNLFNKRQAICQICLSDRNVIICQPIIRP